ncbi:MAG: class A beta-lactamase [Phenylobacterium sp.]|uniref:class A beta-lactamase n=1 Tax=Phenylobacterium sp. TaxID=1871053 RepID=UPI001B5925D2|nr:class A beta-lactamase [Phenylobacterium sp.]MBP7815696.1 class A beta-lactamase [Phenylobacterium sp.]
MKLPVLFAFAALALAACGSGSPQRAPETPPLNLPQLTTEVSAIAERARPGVLGVGLMNLESGETWDFNGERRFPMQSVFKAPLGAAVLAEVDAGRLKLDDTLTLAEEDLSPPLSPIADAYPGRRDYTVSELLTAATGASDNTAADVLMKRIGGPGAVTAWLVGKKVDEIRVDRYERQLQPDSVGMASFRPAWKGSQAYMAAFNSVPPAARRKAVAAYLSDPQDTATPRGALIFLDKLDDGELLAPASRALLLEIMTQTTTGQDRLKAGFPPGSSLAHKTGTARTDQGMNPAFNDMGIVTLADGRRYAVAVFLSGSTLGDAANEKVLADVARAVTRGVR